MKQSEYLPAVELARKFGVSPATISRWSFEQPNGFPAPVLIGARRLFLRHEVDAYVEQQMAARPRVAA